LYLLDADGNISTAEWLDAEDDDGAIEQARKRKLKVVCEVWNRSRLVARIEPGSSA
jgi:hypothetical protein